MENQHGVNIVVLEVQTEMALDVAEEEVVDPWKGRDGNERLQRDAMLHLTSVVNKEKKTM